MNYRSLIEAASAVRASVNASYYRLPGKSSRYLYRREWRGSRKPPERLSASTELFDFLKEHGEAVAALSRRESPMKGLFLDEDSESALAFPVLHGPSGELTGVLFLSSSSPLAFSGSCIEELERLIALSGPPEEKR
jgi:hypothetical protein